MKTIFLKCAIPLLLLSVFISYSNAPISITKRRYNRGWDIETAQRVKTFKYVSDNKSVKHLRKTIPDKPSVIKDTTAGIHHSDSTLLASDNNEEAFRIIKHYKPILLKSVYHISQIPKLYLQNSLHNDKFHHENYKKKKLELFTVLSIFTFIAGIMLRYTYFGIIFYAVSFIFSIIGFILTINHRAQYWGMGFDIAIFIIILLIFLYIIAIIAMLNSLS